MNRIPFATVTILALITLALCCQMLPVAHAHGTAEPLPAPMAHLMLLAMELPIQALVIAALIAVLLLLSDTLPPLSSTEILIPAFLRHPPDGVFTTPLRLALSDGILNPKLF